MSEPCLPPEIGVLVTATPEAFLVVDTHGRIVAHNLPAGRLFGAGDTTLAGLLVHDLVPTAHRIAHPAQTGGFFAHPAVRPMSSPRGRVLAQRLDGKVFPAEIGLSPFAVHGQRFVGALVRDVTDRREVETRLVGRERQLARALRLAHLGTWRWDLQARRLEMSPELLTMLGAPRDLGALSLDSTLACLHPDERHSVVARLRDDLQAGRSFAFDTRLLRRDGGGVHVHCDGEVDYDAAEQPAGAFGVVQELTDREILRLTRRYRDLEAEVAERRRMESALRAERDRAQTYFRVAGVMFIGLDAQGRVEVANERAAEILGRPVAEIVGSDWFASFLPSADAEAARGVFERILAGRSVPEATYESVVLRADGTQRLIAWQSTSLRGEMGHVAGVMSSGQDITERRQAELSLKRTVQEIRAANRELESFAYTVAHDLRTPLRSIQGFSQILIADHGQHLDAEASDLLARIAQNAERLNELTEHLLALSRVGRAVLNVQPVDLATVAREIVQGYAIGGQEPSGRSITGAPGGAPPPGPEWVIPESLPAKADPALVRVLLQNLLGNARKFTRRAAGPLVVLGREPDGAYFLRDNGVGFDMAFADKLFRPFQRLHDREFEGNGVGLATVARVAERHGGRVWAESGPGPGATFRFTLGE